jgi:hypothetical protein
MFQDGTLKGYYVLKEPAISILREEFIFVKKTYFFYSGDGDAKFLRNVVAVYQTTRHHFLDDFAALRTSDLITCVASQEKSCECEACRLTPPVFGNCLHENTTFGETLSRGAIRPVETIL